MQSTDGKTYTLIETIKKVSLKTHQKTNYKPYTHTKKMENQLYLVDIDKKFDGYAHATISRESGRVHYTDMNVSEYLKERKIKNYHMLEWDDFYERYYIPYNNRLSTKPFMLISKDDYFEALECLPPMRWHNATKGVNIFFIMEAYTADLHHCYLCINNGRVTKYYSGLRSKFMTDEELINQLRDQKII